MDKLIPFIEAVGYLGIFGMIFLETGLLIGFFLPGDTLLFAAGLLASKGLFSIVALLAGACFAAIIGDSVGYYIGTRIGPKLFTREDSRFFKKRYAFRAQHFFDKHGKKTVFLARFIPIVRTFVPVVAGVGTMRYRTFFVFNVLGGIAWCSSIILIGYFLGTRVSNIDAYVLPIIAGIFVLSMIPVVRQFYASSRGTPRI